MDMRLYILFVLGFVQLCNSQSTSSEDDRGLNHKRKHHHHHHHHHHNQQQQSIPCRSYDEYDPVDNDVQGRKLFLAAAAGIGGAALGYHIGMKHQNQLQPIINNNIYNEYPPPCVVVQSGGHGSGGGGILGHHPILSNILQNGVLGNGGLLGGGGSVQNDGGSGINNRPVDINWNRAIRQFSRLFRVFR